MRRFLTPWGWAQPNQSSWEHVDCAVCFVTFGRELNNRRHCPRCGWDGTKYVALTALELLHARRDMLLLFLLSTIA